MSACTVRAVLRENARAVPSGTDKAALHLLLRIDGHQHGVLATQAYAGVGAGWMAAKDAQRFTRGRQVTVWCAGFGTDGDGRLRLFGVDHVLANAVHAEKGAA